MLEPKKPGAAVVAKPAAETSPAKPQPAPAPVKAKPVPQPAKAVAAPESPLPVPAPIPAPAAVKATPVARKAQPVKAKAAPVRKAAAPVAAKAPVAPPVVKQSVVKPLAAEGKTIMATTATEAATDKFQTAFADVQGRTKAALEKSAKFYEDLGEFTKGNIEAVIASSKVAASAAETLGQDAAAFGKKNLEQATATFKSLAAAKSPTELMQLQSDYARSAFDSLVAESSRVSEKLVKLAGEIAQPLSSRFAVAAEKVKATTSL